VDRPNKSDSLNIAQVLVLPSQIVKETRLIVPLMQPRKEVPPNAKIVRAVVMKNLPFVGRPQE
jgi:hypothetical protein